MKSLYLRIYLTVLAALALFAFASGWLVQRHLSDERGRFEAAQRERTEAWAELLQRAMPGAEAPQAEQDTALREWSQRLRVPLALDDAKGQRVSTSESFARREADPGPNYARRLMPVKFTDGRTLWLLTRGGPGVRPGPPGLAGAPPRVPGGWLLPAGWPEGVSLAVLLLLLFAAVAAGAWPVVRRLTRRLEALKAGVDAFGAGDLQRRVAEDGHDEVATLGASFNQAAGRIEALLVTHKSLLANASHELRSPLARLKMAVAMLEDAPEAQRDALKREIHADIAELDALVEEVLLASRLDAAGAGERPEEVDLLALGAEEAARTGASAAGEAAVVVGHERLLRRAVRNLLENARRYGAGSEVALEVERMPAAAGAGVQVVVSDRGPGVPDAHRERIFEPFFRLPGHAERAGGVGLGLSLVRQIAERHGGSVRCEPRDGGGSRFVLSLPARPPAAPGSRRAAPATSDRA